MSEMRSRPAKLFTDFAHLRKIGLDTSFPRLRKDEYKALIRAAGCQTAETYALAADPNALVEADLPDRFVLKPDCLTQSRGVMVLHRQQDGTYRDTMVQRSITWPAIVEEQSRLRREFEQRLPGEQFAVVVEERVVGEGDPDAIPFDYKVHVFADGCALVTQIDRNVSPIAMCWFDGAFRPIDPRGKVEWNPREVSLGTHVIPRCAHAILEAASRLRNALNVAYMRADTYATANGPVIGEVTPGVGGFYQAYGTRFTMAFEREFGERWRNSVAMLGLPFFAMPPGAVTPAARKRSARRWFHETPWTLHAREKTPRRWRP